MRKIAQIFVCFSENPNFTFVQDFFLAEFRLELMKNYIVVCQIEFWIIFHEN